MVKHETRTNSRPFPASFRDPSGFIFIRDGSVWRQVNRIYKENYDHLMDSGLYSSLVGSGSLIAHHEEETVPHEDEAAYRIIKPQRIPFISYPYEWCFSQLREAALLTLGIQKEALRYGMTLKDSSAFNVQFIGARPVFLDTLSFEKYREGVPWVAYRQFCQHFLCPLALMSYRDIRLSQLLRVHLDGIPLDLASSILPKRTYARLSLLSHIHLHARSQRFFEKKMVHTGGRQVSRLGLLGLIGSLETCVRNLRSPSPRSAWKEYYDTEGSYSSDALFHKKELVRDILGKIQPKTLWDYGANTGVFSRLASEMGIYTISLDSDPLCVEHNYLQSVEAGETNVLPLLVDLTNPSPPLGWEYQERMSWSERGPADAILSLALLHHLAIGNNLPLSRIAESFSGSCNHLVIEFVPKTDSQVQRMLSSREDVFPDYTRECFESAFARHFILSVMHRIRGTERILYLMENKSRPA
jgi:hypothetical protein